MIAISYRREDSLAVTGRLYDRLEQRFGKQNVFMDFDSIRPGFDFRNQIKETIERSKVVIAVIGPNWLGEASDGSRRIDNPTDFVRLEVACALARGIPVIPVLLNDTPMPDPDSLPTDIKELAYRHALPLDSGLDFRQHADRLITGIIDLAEPAHAASVDARANQNNGSRRRRAPIAAGVIAIVLFLIVIAFWARSARRDNPSPELSKSQPTEITAIPPEPKPDFQGVETDYAQSMVHLGQERVHNTDDAIRIVEKAAEKHLPEAELRVALWKFEGYMGIDKNPIEGKQLEAAAMADGLEKRAEEGNAAAQDTLGDMYSRGLGVPKDLTTAVKWYEKSSEQNFAPAQYHVGCFYSLGLDGLLPRDPAKQVELMEKAATQGYADAQYFLGCLYRSDSTGVPQDTKKAADYFKKAADQGVASARDALQELQTNLSADPKVVPVAPINHEISNQASPSAEKPKLFAGTWEGLNHIAINGKTTPGDQGSRLRLMIDRNETSATVGDLPTRGWVRSGARTLIWRKPGSGRAFYSITISPDGKSAMFKEDASPAPVSSHALLYRQR